MFTPRTVATYLTLGLLAAVTWWLADGLTPTDEKMLKSEPSQIDYYSINVTRTVLDEAGKPKELLFAETMTHYKNNDLTKLKKPVMTLYKKEGEQPWVIHAGAGTVRSGGDTIFLYGNVLITRDVGDNGLLQIMTKNIKVEPDNDYAETQEKVRILSAQDELTGTGMQVHFKPALNIKLLADVWRKHEVR